MEHRFNVSASGGAADSAACRWAVRLCMAVDVEAYSRFTNVEAVRVQERLIVMLRRVRAYAGIEEAEVGLQPSGDGQFAVLPSGIDESVVIPGLVAGLSFALRDANADLTARAQLRLRVALHRGLLGQAANGWVGNAAIAVHRLLDSAPLRVALRTRQQAEFALLVSDVLYRDVIAHGYQGLAPGLFQATGVDVPAKRFNEQAWLYLPR